MICDAIQRLINYGITQNLITKADQFVVQNQLMEALQLTDWQLSGAAATIADWRRAGAHCLCGRGSGGVGWL